MAMDEEKIGLMIGGGLLVALAVYAIAGGKESGGYLDAWQKDQEGDEPEPDDGGGDDGDPEPWPEDAPPLGSTDDRDPIDQDQPQGLKSVPLGGPT